MKRIFDVPPGLTGRRRDPLLIGLTAVFTGVQFVRGLRPPKLTEPEPGEQGLDLTVTEVAAAAEGVVSLRLAAPNGAVLPGWQPGGHLDLTLPSGRRRQYSLCGDPGDRRGFRIATRLIEGGGGGSAEVHSLAVGDRLTAHGPRNAFPFLRAERYLFLAGGIGITPILPMVWAAARAGADWRLVYTGRSRASLPFLAELPEGEVLVRADDESGPPDAAEWLAGVSGTAVYCCGPEPMIESVRRHFTRDHGTLHFERFAPAPIVGGRAFTLRLERSGRTVEVGPEESALSALRRVLPDVGYSCRQGFCGTCRVRTAAGGSMLVCVDRPNGDGIVLDL